MQKKKSSSQENKENILSPNKIRKIDENNKSLIGSPTKNMNELRIDEDYMINLKKLEIQSNEEIP